MFEGGLVDDVYPPLKLRDFFFEAGALQIVSKVVQQAAYWTVEEVHSIYLLQGAELANHLADLLLYVRLLRGACMHLSALEEQRF